MNKALKNRLDEIRRGFKKVGDRWVYDGDISFVSQKDLKTLVGIIPERATINGFLNLTGSGILELPSDLAIRDYLSLISAPINKLPSNLSVGGCLSLAGSAVCEIPKDLKVGTFIELKHTSIIGYPVAYDCGKSSRAIYLSVKDKNIIHIGCFKGTKQEAIDKITGAIEYSALEVAEYVKKVEQCFSMWDFENDCFVPPSK